MARVSSQQIALKPQDLVALLALAARGEATTYADLAAETRCSRRADPLSGSATRAVEASVARVRPVRREVCVSGRHRPADPRGGNGVCRCATQRGDRAFIRSASGMASQERQHQRGTKFEAFANRGKADLLASHDLEDVLNVVAGREQLAEEIRQSSLELRRYLAQQCRELLAMRDFEHYLPGLIQDDSSGERSDLVLELLRAIEEMGG